MQRRADIVWPIGAIRRPSSLWCRNTNSASSIKEVYISCVNVFSLIVFIVFKNKWGAKLCVGTDVLMVMYPRLVASTDNYAVTKDFLAEIKRMKKWYSSPRRLAQRRFGIVRTGPGCADEVKGQRCVLFAKLSTHYRRLVQPRRLEGLMAWQECAEGLRAAGIDPQSGTVPVERSWNIATSFWPR